jgi:acyl-CoA synthetase (NDP forming)
VWSTLLVTSTFEQLSKLLEARSVVLVGASTRDRVPAGRPLAYLRRYDYAGQIYVVNPRHEIVQEIRAYPTIGELPEAPELAIVSLPAEAVPDALRELGQRGCRAAVSFANGFADAGDDVAQDELSAAIRESGVRLLGPNCLGFVNIHNRLTASFSSYLLRRMFIAGDIGLVTQSGSIGNAIMMEFQSRGIGTAKWVTTGNEADIDALDVADYLIGDPLTGAVVVYGESFLDGARWRNLGERAQAANKPLIVLKAGQGPAARAAVESHSGKIAGAPEVWRDVAEQAQIVTAQTLQELVDCTYVATRAPKLRTVSGVGVVGTGGFGVLAADSCGRSDLPVATLASSTVSTLQSLLPRGATTTNPVDPTPTPDEVYFSAATHTIRDENVDVLVVCVTALRHDYSTVAQNLRSIAAAEPAKTVVVSYLASMDSLPADLVHDLEESGILVFPNSDHAINAISKVCRTEPNHAAGVLEAQPTHRGGSPAGLGLLELGGALKRAGIPIVRSAVVDSAADFRSAIADLGYPIVMKLESPNVAHKTELGHVRTNLHTESDALSALTALQRERERYAGTITAQQQVAIGLELIVACRKDPEFGPVVSVGAGGTLVELIDDVRTRLLPITAQQASELLDRTRIGTLIHGIRGEQGYDVSSVIGLIVSVSGYFTESDLTDLELNPVILTRRLPHLTVVDVLAHR